MRTSAKVEYACIAMMELAAGHGEAGLVHVKQIADRHGIPPRFLVHILLQLKASGLVASARGASGGYQLARPAEEISLADVINAVDRSPTPRPAPLSSPNSPVVQAVRGIWKQFQAEEQRRLEELSLADLVRRAQPENEPSYQI